jgi:hypothetical protein
MSRSACAASQHVAAVQECHLRSGEKCVDARFRTAGFDDDVVHLPAGPVIGPQQLAAVPVAVRVAAAGPAGAGLGMDEYRPHLGVRPAQRGRAIGERDALADGGLPQTAAQRRSAVVRVGGDDDRVAEVVVAPSPDAVEIVGGQRADVEGVHGRPHVRRQVPLSSRAGDVAGIAASRRWSY